MTEKDKMHIGELYLPDDKEIMEWQTKCLHTKGHYNISIALGLLTHITSVSNTLH